MLLLGQDVRIIVTPYSGFMVEVEEILRNGWSRGAQVLAFD